MEMKKPDNIEYKKAYYVQSWGDKVIKGYAFTFTYMDWYEKTKVFFIEDVEMQLPTMVEKRNVVYSALEATVLLRNELKDKKEYYEKQLKEAQEKITIINKTL